MNSVVAVMPVLVGPLQVLLALLPAILAALGGMLLAMFKPSGFKKLVRFFWHQKLFTALLIATGVALWYGYPKRLWSSPRPAGEVSDEARVSAWPMLRGGPERMGWSSGDDPTAPAANWAWTDHKTVFGSPTVAGGRVYFSTVTDLGPFTPQGRGAIVCCDAESGRELWRYDDEGRYRATFSAPVVAEERVVVGEGLHITADARVTCLDLSGRKIWEYRTMSHVEATPCIDSGRVYISAAGDGFYCFSLTPNDDGSPRVLWHLQGEKYPDCESSPVTDGRTVWFGLGEGGNALVAVDAETGEERWRAGTPHPVFTGPTLAGGKLFIGVGNGNFIVSAEELRARRLEEMKEAGAPKAAIDAAYEELAPYGAVWCVDAETGKVDWQFQLKETVLDSIACRDGRLHFGSRDGTFYTLTTDGKELGHWDAGAIILASAAAGRSHVYVATNAGRLHCLKADTLAPVWDMPLQGEGVMSSSPTLAGGRVYLGTDTAGLRCVGTTEPPEPPVWTNKGGGLVGDGGIPRRVRVAWQFPQSEPTDGRAGPRRIRVAASPMPLADSLYVIGAEPAADVPDQPAGQELEKFPRENWKPHVIKLRLDNGLAESDRLQWSVALKGRLSPRRLFGSGDHILIQSHGGEREDYSRQSELLCLHAADGHELWKQQTSADLESALDARRAFAFLGPSPLRAGSVETIAALDLATGAKLWATDIQQHNDESLSPTSLAASNDLVIALFGSAQPDKHRVVVLDAPTGRVVWGRRFEMSVEPFDVMVAGDKLVFRSSRGLIALSLLDGKGLWASATDSLGDTTLTESGFAAVDAEGNLVFLSGHDGTAIRTVSGDGPLGFAPAPVSRGGSTLFATPKSWKRWDSELEDTFDWFRPNDLGGDLLKTPLVMHGRRAYCAYATSLVRSKIVCLEPDEN